MGLAARAQTGLLHPVGWEWRTAAAADRSISWPISWLVRCPGEVLSHSARQPASPADTTRWQADPGGRPHSHTTTQYQRVNFQCSGLTPLGQPDRRLMTLELRGKVHGVCPHQDRQGSSHSLGQPAPTTSPPCTPQEAILWWRKKQNKQTTPPPQKKKKPVNAKNKGCLFNHRGEARS